MKKSFDTDAYISLQIERIQEKLSSYNGPSYIEFGGKPFGDMHAARVLPGYDMDCKVHILHRIGIVAKIVMVINARDILPEPTGRYPNGRTRGDSGLKYQHETIRMIREARGLGIHIETAILAVTPRTLREEDQARIESFRTSLARENIKLKRHFEIVRYPDPSILAEKDAVFASNDVIAEWNKHLVVFSPGGGSGKFSVILSEMHHAFKRGEIPHFVKFETFPVFALPRSHALNLAFEAATADLDNKVVTLREGLTSYDKDIENFVLLVTLSRTACIPDTHPIQRMVRPTDMGVNIIDQAIDDMPGVIQACGIEIMRRYKRYQDEYAAGEGSARTVARALAILQEFDKRYAAHVP